MGCYVLLQGIFPTQGLNNTSSSGEGNGNPLQYSYLENHMDGRAYQALLSTGFSRQEYWSGLLCPPPRDLPDSGMELLHWQVDSLLLSHQGGLAHFLIGSFIFLELSCRSCLYILEISCLSVASFAIIFSHSEGCLFTLLIVSFVVQKLLSLI